MSWRRKLGAIIAGGVLLIAAITVVLALYGQAWGETLLEPWRAEFRPAPVDPAPSQWDGPAKFTLKTEPCRYWLGFSC